MSDEGGGGVWRRRGTLPMGGGRGMGPRLREDTEEGARIGGGWVWRRRGTLSVEDIDAGSPHPRGQEGEDGSGVGGGSFGFASFGFAGLRSGRAGQAGGRGMGFRVREGKRGMGLASVGDPSASLPSASRGFAQDGQDRQGGGGWVSAGARTRGEWVWRRRGLLRPRSGRAGGREGWVLAGARIKRG